VIETRTRAAAAPAVSRGARLSAFLRCASCRFAAFYFIPFLAGLVQMDAATVPYVAFGALFWLVESLAVEVTNRLADRAEDALNRPERTALCEQVGWPTLARAQRGLWGAVAALSVAWLLVDGNPALAVILAAGVALGVAYSRGPRLARRRWFAFVAVNMLFGGAFLTGWAAGGPPGELGWGQLATNTAFVTVVGVFILAFAGIKDLTDREGDVRAGYRSPFLELVDRRGTVPLAALALAPFALVWGLVAGGVLPVRLVALTAFAPCSLLLARAVRQGRSPGDQMAIRECFYVYWLVFGSAAVLLFVPSWTLAAGVAGAVGYWIVTTRTLHWAAGLSVAELRRLVRLALGDETARTPSGYATPAGR
jgi:4-hydroxybenzoate polyprenyltransferase